MNFSLLKSELTGDEKHFYKSQPVGNQFTHSVGEIINQGENPTCAVCTFLNWRFPDKGYWDPQELFQRVGGTQNGISFKQILSYLREKGVIQEYALIHSEQSLRTAIRVNGPCLGALNVYNDWDGKNLEGKYGISIIGWKDEDFIVRNNQGNILLPANRFNLLQEIWTIIA